MTQAYQYGNTVRLLCTFTDFGGETTDPQSIRVIFYDYTFVKFDEVMLGVENRISEGKYYYDLVIPSDRRDRIYYEWRGEVDGTPALKRGELRVVFV